jgi:hypothetical protein
MRAIFVTAAVIGVIVVIIIATTAAKRGVHLTQHAVIGLGTQGGGGAIQVHLCGVLLVLVVQKQPK